jgi:hypothetical protein
MQRFLHLLLLITPFVCFSQSKIILHLNSDSIQKIASNYTENFKDTIEVNKYLSQLRLKAIKKGYLLTSLDSKKYSNDTLYCSIFIGPSIKHAIIKHKSNDTFWLSTSRRRKEQLISATILNSYEVYDLLYNCENKLNNNGYPFAQTSLINISFKSDTLMCQLDIQKNAFFKWGEIVNRGEKVISDKILYTFIGLQKEQSYSESDKNEISNRIKIHPYIEETRPFELLFNKDKVDIYFYLKSKPISSASGTLGLQQKTNNSGYTVVGDLKLKLTNILRQGENLDVQWKNLQNNTQSLKSTLNFPSILTTLFGSEIQFQLFKRDSSFIELKTAFSLQYLLKNGNILKINYKHLSSSILNTSSNSSSLGNTNTNYYGFSINKQNIDYTPSPTRGYTFNIDIALGVRNSEDKINTRIKTENTSKTESSINYYFSVKKRHVIRLFQANEIFIAPSFYQNELIRFGGLGTQRGFREEELRASSRISGSIEYRFLLDKNSYLFLFYDQSWYENKIATTKRDTPFGIGSGLSFGTEIGIFSISYGIGKQLNNPLLIKNGNIHFGYISYF